MVDSLDVMKHTPLFRACEMGHRDVILTLIQGWCGWDISMSVPIICSPECSFSILLFNRHECVAHQSFKCLTLIEL